MYSRLFFGLAVIIGLTTSFLSAPPAHAGESVGSSTYSRSTERLPGAGPSLFEIGLGYNFIDLQNAEVDHLHGADVSLFVNLTRWLALGGDFIAGFGSQDRGFVTFEGQRYVYVVGPRVSVWPAPTVRIFAQALGGGVHGNAEASFSGFNQSASADAFAAIAGVGVDWRFTRNFYWRIIEADYLRMNFTNQNDNFRLSTGLIFTFGGRN